MSTSLHLDSKGQHVCNLQERPDLFDIPMNPFKKLFLRGIIASEKNPIHKLHLRSSGALAFEKRRQIYSKSWYVIHPMSYLAGGWYVFMFVVYMLNVFDAPFSCHDDTLVLQILTTCFSSFAGLNVLVCFFMGYVDRDTMEIVLHHGEIGRNYLRGWFAVDLLGFLPIITIITFLGTFFGVHFTDDVLYRMCILRVLKICQFRLFLDSAKKCLMYFRATASNARIVKIIIATRTIIHWLACMQYFIPLCVHGTNLKNVNESWLNFSPFPQEKTVLELDPYSRYLKCLFKATSQIMILGYGQDYPQTKEDSYLFIFTVIMGRVYFFYLVEEILSMGWVFSPRVKYYAMVEQINQYMIRKQLPPTTRDKIKIFYEYRMNQTYFDERIITSLLSEKLREEVYIFETSKIVSKSGMFRHLPKEVLNDMLSYAVQDVYLPNDVLMKAGAYSDCIMILTHGAVAVYSKYGDELRHLHEVTILGELEVVTNEERRFATIVAIEICEVIRIDAEVFNRFVRQHHEMLTEMRPIAIERAAMMKRMEKAMNISRAYSHVA